MCKRTLQVDCIWTASGRKIALLDPNPAEIVIEDIATGLARQCRFNGQCLLFYSVAQHSEIVSRHVPRGLALAGLLHDAAEAYLGDIIHPLKRMLHRYKEIERVWERAISDKWRVDIDAPAVKRADRRCVFAERRDNLLPIAASEAWHEEGRYRALDERIKPVGERAARRLFMARYRALTAGRPFLH